MSDTAGRSGALWERSSYSNANGGPCLELVRDGEGVVPVRDSKNPTTALLLPAAAWAAFVGHLKR